MEERFLVTSSPHVYDRDSISRIMLDVVIALLIPLIGGVYFFGVQALILAAVSVAACVVFEYLWCAVCKKKSTIHDCSAIVTGLLLAMSVPATLPLWMVIVGDFFAIVIVKQFFGGIGKNFMNPALAARALLLASFPVPMTTWVNALASRGGIDAVSSATPLAVAKAGEMGAYSYMDLFLGKVPGCIGETSVLLLLIGAAYLLIRGVIHLRVPLFYLGTLAVVTFVFGGETLFAGDFLYHLLSGGVVLGAFFMATDYTTSPITPKGKIIMGIGCGLITAVIRLYGGYPEGVTYAILFMNALTPLIDRLTLPKRFGEVRKHA